MTDNNGKIKTGVKNILNSPLVSCETDGSERYLTEPVLLYIRQLHNPVNASHFEMASLFKETINPNCIHGEEWRKNNLIQYEQYFARLELLNMIWQEEARMRQLLLEHLLPQDSWKPYLLDKKIIDANGKPQNTFILDEMFSLLKRYIKNEL